MHIVSAASSEPGACVPQAATELKEQAQRAKDAAATGPSMSLNARSDIVEQTSAQAGEWAYARQVEITNGRWAMLGACDYIPDVFLRVLRGFRASPTALFSPRNHNSAPLQQPAALL